MDSPYYNSHFHDYHLMVASHPDCLNCIQSTILASATSCVEIIINVLTSSFPIVLFQPNLSVGSSVLGVC